MGYSFLAPEGGLQEAQEKDDQDDDYDEPDDSHWVSSLHSVSRAGGMADARGQWQR